MFTTFDKTELFYRTWEPSVQASGEKKALIVLHRGHEHSDRLHDLIEGMDCGDFWAFGYDGRGHGKSPGPRGYAPDFSYLVKDLDTFVRYITTKHDIKMENIFVVANSVGAVVASTWVHDFAPRIRGMVLAAPAFQVKLYVPLALPSLRVLDKLKHPAFISSYVKSRFLTHDPEQAKKYDEDPLITPDIAVNILVGLYDNANRVVTDAGAITIPTLVFSAGRDFVVSNTPQHKFFEGLSSKKKEFITLDGFFHGVLYEKDRHRPFAEAARFIKECFAMGYSPVNLIAAHREGYTKREYDSLKQAPPLHRSLSYFFQKLSMSTLGRLSKGIRIGFKHGFDSGVSLDHVYENQAKGEAIIGKIIDWFYINAIGWRGIRQRKVHIQIALETVIENTLKAGKPVRIMDIGAGPGRYLQELAKKYADKDFQVMIRDFAPANIEQGKAIASQFGLKNVTLKVADAFSPASYDANEFRPNILVVSGLFELFPDNDLITKAIAGATGILEDGGMIVYTGQPWHPQLEMIAHTLPNRDGVQWIMRRRTQEELDQLFHTYGAEKCDMWIDRWGIFTVSVANFKKSARLDKVG
jgi:alpha-beta hydrolase superfamily lysophospholipase/ubiquinone/menaquinone biosynthesis C-methylase UbiE